MKNSPKWSRCAISRHVSGNVSEKHSALAKVLFAPLKADRPFLPEALSRWENSSGSLDGKSEDASIQTFSVPREHVYVIYYGTFYFSLAETVQKLFLDAGSALPSKSSQRCFCRWHHNHLEMAQRLKTTSLLLPTTHSWSVVSSFVPVGGIFLASIRFRIK